MNLGPKPLSFSHIPPASLPESHLTWLALVHQRQSNAAVLTTVGGESPAPGHTQHVQPQDTNGGVQPERE